MLTVMTCLALLVAGRTTILWRELVDFEFVRSSGSCGLTLELRRRAMLCTSAGDTHEYPQPREARVLVLRLFGAPVLCRREIIGLPLHFDARVRQLRAEDFDSQFSARFRRVDARDDAGSLKLLWRA